MNGIYGKPVIKTSKISHNGAEPISSLKSPACQSVEIGAVLGFEIIFVGLVQGVRVSLSCIPELRVCSYNCPTMVS